MGQVSKVSWYCLNDWFCFELISRLVVKNYELNSEMPVERNPATIYYYADYCVSSIHTCDYNTDGCLVSVV